MLQPARLVPPFGEGVLAAEAAREIAEDVEVVARFADRINRLVRPNGNGVEQACDSSPSLATTTKA